ncbi:MAG: RluA family pseudouridine synthase [Ruminococcaceae bacterium]|nr:RluA family pseudouridine synthase [Oscillospiraceae bacterium]
MRILYIGKNDAGQRLDKFITKTLKAFPMPLLYKSIRTKKIKVNRKRTEPGYVLLEGDTVQLFIAEEFFEPDAAERAFMKLKPSIDVVYEDENIILVNKQPGLIVHSDENEEVNTLIGHIKAYLYKKGEYDPDNEQSFAPALCNRIDRNTGGIVLAAKTAAALRFFNEKIKMHELDKYYLCAVHGKMPKREDTLVGYLKKDTDKNMVDIKEKGAAGYKEIITKYKLLEQKGELSLLEIELITGKTHQIRAHMSSIGHPLLGDGKYGINKDDRKAGYAYQALYAYKLCFSYKKSNSEFDYLSNQSFTCDPSKIYFLKEFDLYKKEMKGK